MQNTIKYIANNFEKYKEQKLVPLHVRIETSEACNYRCNFCVFHDPERNSEVADTIDMKNRLIELKRCKELIKECQEIGVTCNHSLFFSQIFLPYAHSVQLVQMVYTIVYV